MPTPEIEPHWLLKAVDWIWAVVLGLIGLVYKGNERKLEEIDAKLKDKADAEDMKKALVHIEKLYNNAEFDRRFTRDLYDKAVETQRIQHQEIVRLITAEGGRRK